MNAPQNDSFTQNFLFSFGTSYVRVKVSYTNTFFVTIIIFKDLTIKPRSENLGKGP